MTPQLPPCGLLRRTEVWGAFLGSPHGVLTGTVSPLECQQHPTTAPDARVHLCLFKGPAVLPLFSEEETPTPSHPQQTPTCLPRSPLGPSVPYLRLRLGCAPPCAPQHTTGSVLFYEPPLGFPSQSDIVGDPFTSCPTTPTPFTSQCSTAELLARNKGTVFSSLLESLMPWGTTHPLYAAVDSQCLCPGAVRSRVRFTLKRMWAGCGHPQTSQIH